MQHRCCVMLDTYPTIQKIVFINSSSFRESLNRVAKNFAFLKSFYNVDIFFKENWDFAFTTINHSKIKQKNALSIKTD